MVSSVSVDGGASFTAINLAAAFAMDERRTALYIDCNLHDPYATKLLPAEPEYGLTDYLENPELNIEDIIYASGIPRLRIRSEERRVGKECRSRVRSEYRRRDR